MPGWLIIIIVCVVIGAAIGIVASISDKEIKPHQGCLSGALMGGAGGIGCIAMILEIILPIIIAFLVFSWLFEGCS